MRTEVFFSHLEDETNRLQKLHGSVQKVAYHRHYLAVEAINKIEDYREKRGKNRAKSTRQLVGSVVAMMGQFSKITDYEGDSDFDLNFVHFLSEEAYIQHKNHSTLNLDAAIGSLVEYNNLIDTDKRKATKALIKAGVAVLTEYNRIEG